MPRRRRTKARKAPAFPTGVEARYRAMMLRRIRALDRLVRTEILPALDPMDTRRSWAAATSSVSMLSAGRLP